METPNHKVKKPEIQITPPLIKIEMEEDVDIVNINSPTTPLKKNESFFLEEPEIKDVISPALSFDDRRDSFLDLSEDRNSSVDESLEDHPEILKFFKH